MKIDKPLFSQSINRKSISKDQFKDKETNKRLHLSHIKTEKIRNFEPSSEERVIKSEKIQIIMQLHI